MYDARRDPASRSSLAACNVSLNTKSVAMHPILDMKLGPVLLLALATCAGSSDEARIARHAADVLGVPAASLRVMARSDLTGEQHDFYLVTQDGGPSLTVVAPRHGPLFDGRTPDAFTRVARTEDAAARITKLGAERVSLWFAALGGGVCSGPPTEQAHFATVTHDLDGSVHLAYPFPGGPGVEREFSIDLNRDGSLRAARAIDGSAPRAQASPWKN
jgi:hypothetical protein